MIISLFIANGVNLHVGFVLLHYLYGSLFMLRLSRLKMDAVRYCAALPEGVGGRKASQ
ncbi:MAG: hypothetical protein FWC42_04790 [Proteobacteria bacterium]|nr:hypothetical protein [Pseudomonadota bacterium]